MFNENNTVQRHITAILHELGWREVKAVVLHRSIRDVFLLDELTAALQRLNPEIAAQPARAEEVIHRLRAILLAVQTDGLIRANQFMSDWLRNDHTMPFGKDNGHVPIRLIDYDNVGTPQDNNSYIVAEEVTFKPANVEKRFDHVLFVNGIPLVVGEAKTPVNNHYSWFDAAFQLQGYEESVPQFFAPNVFSFASEGKVYRYGSVQAPLQHWGPWHADRSPIFQIGHRTRGSEYKGSRTGGSEYGGSRTRGSDYGGGRTGGSDYEAEGLQAVGETVRAMLDRRVVLDMLRHFTTYATNKQGRMIKIIARYQQYYAALKIVRRVVLGRPRKGLIWHFQGSGKSLLMLFAAQLLRAIPELQKPTVLVIVDRVDLDTQISGTFMANDVANVVTTDKRDELQTLLRQGARKIIITTVHKFGVVPHLT